MSIHITHRLWMNRVLWLLFYEYLPILLLICEHNDPTRELAPIRRVQKFEHLHTEMLHLPFQNRKQDVT